MFSLTIFAIVAIVLFFLLRATIFPLIKKSFLNRRLRTEGVEGQAIILSMQQTGLYVNNLPQVKMQMKVEQPAGRNFIAETKEVLTFIELSMIRVGSKMTVRYNPENHKEIMICE